MGFTVQPGGQHPQFGTHNAAWRLDARYIELIAVRDETVAHAAQTGRRSTRRCALVAVSWALESSSPTSRQRWRTCVHGASPWVIHKLGRSGEPTAPPARGKVPRSRMGPVWAPLFINYGLPIDDWAARFRSRDSRRIHGPTRRGWRVSQWAISADGFLSALPEGWPGRPGQFASRGSGSPIRLCQPEMPVAVGLARSRPDSAPWSPTNRQQMIKKAWPPSGDQAS